MLAGQESIFGYLQKMNGLYFIPIFAVVLVGMLTRRVPAFAAKFALVSGFVIVNREEAYKAVDIDLIARENVLSFSYIP